MSTPLKPVSFLESDRVTRERTDRIMRRAQEMVRKINDAVSDEKLKILLQFAAAGKRVRVKGVNASWDPWEYCGFLVRDGEKFFRVLSAQDGYVGGFHVRGFEEIEQIEE